MRDPYDILGLGPSASTAEIKAAYRRLAKKYHPDAQGTETAAGTQSRFQEVTAAYNLLKDAGARARHAQTGGPFQDAPYMRPGASQEPIFETDMAGSAEQNGDLFSELFGGLRNAHKRVFRARGEDQTYRLSVPFLEAVCGTKRRVTLNNGKTLDVRIPAGIEDDQQIRLRGQGGEGFGGAPAGDALISVAVEAHDAFRRDGLDIYATLPISLPEAVLGAKIDVETVSGPVTLSIPAGANTGTRLRLKGKGIAPEAGREIGDHYVTLELMLPEKPDSAMRDFAASWAQGLSHAPRKKP